MRITLNTYTRAVDSKSLIALAVSRLAATPASGDAGAVKVIRVIAIDPEADVLGAGRSTDIIGVWSKTRSFRTFR